MSERGLDLLLAWAMGGKNTKTANDPKRTGLKKERGDERGTKLHLPIPLPSDLLSGLLPDLTPSAKHQPPVRSLEPVKLGPAPLEPKFKREVLRELEEPYEVDSSLSAEVAPPPDQLSWVSPQPGELPPYPATFKIVDVAREAEAIRQARKRIRLSAEAFEKDESRVNERVFAAYGVMGRKKTKGEKEEGKKPSVCMFTIHDAGETLTSVKFSRDATLMATGFSESYIRLWNLKGEPLRPIKSDFDPSTITHPKQLKKVPSTSPTLKLLSHSGPVYSLAFDPSSGPSSPPRFLLSSSQDASVRLWSMHTYTPLVAYKGHREPVWDVDWGPRGVYFVSGGRDRTARLWNTERVVSLRIFSGHLSDVDTVRFHPNSLYVVTGSSDRTCRMWDVERGDCVRLFTGHSGPVSCIAVSPDGKWLASAGEDKEIKLYDLGTSRVLKTMTGHTSRINSLAFSAESSLLVSGSHDETVRVWDVKAPAEERGEDGRVKGFDDVDMEMLRRGEKRNRDLLATLYTKQTPVLETAFTERNLCLAAGPMVLPQAA
ncbi:WD40 repeat-like protein [Atractiella rhizophila]|nr:WD40 repeat-like protein [Atractiella rhizophila]